MTTRGVPLQGLDPVLDARCQRLILGSMPGVQSLNTATYYAHPRNALWWILSEWLDFDLQLPYRERCRRIVDAGLGFWDVIGQCAREGSLDSAIQTDTVRVNDLMGLLGQHRQIDRILLNGTRAASLFRRHIAGSLLMLDREITVHELPSTSPAHAAMSREEKKARWFDSLA